MILIFVLLSFMLKLFLIYLVILDYLSGAMRSFYGKLCVSRYVVGGFMTKWWVMRSFYFGIITSIYSFMWMFSQGPLCVFKEYSICILVLIHWCLGRIFELLFSWFLTGASSPVFFVWISLIWIQCLWSFIPLVSGGKGGEVAPSYMGRELMI